MPRVKRIVNKFKDPFIIYIERYTEVFNRKNQNFALQKINPAIILLGLVPDNPNIFKAILLCKPLVSIADAIIKPPKNNKTNG